MEKPMKIAIIGGGKRCRAFLEMIDARRFPRLRAQIVAVADPDVNAVGIQRAEQKHIFTTTDYRDFYQIPDLDLVIELTGKEELLDDFLKHYPVKVRVLESTISRLFGDIIRLREEYLFRERQLELIEGIVDSIFLSIRDWVLILQPDLRILDANTAFLEAMGLNKEDVIGRTCHEITHQSPLPCNESGLLCPLQVSLTSGAVAHAIHEHCSCKSRVRYCEVTTVPLKNRKGDAYLILEIVHDITDELEKKLEQKTRALKRNLTRLIHEDKLISLGKLVAGAVHEINNPLSGIHALARLMREELKAGELIGEKKEKFEYYLHLIDSESARCSSIVSDLLSFARQQKVQWKTFQLNDLVRRAIVLGRHRIGNQRIRFQLDLDENLPEMTGDPGQIQQCLLNLLFNAIEAMPHGGRLSVRTSWDSVKDQLRLMVEDEGVGIPPELLSQVFEPFFSTKNQDRGVGLGLSVVYGIVKEHDGMIYVRSEVGQGSKFIIRFPAGGGDARSEEGG